jgi:hypothetical protein
MIRAFLRQSIIVFASGDDAVLHGRQTRGGRRHFGAIAHRIGAPAERGFGVEWNLSSCSGAGRNRSSRERLGLAN